MVETRGATVELREVTKRYGDTVAVDRLSFTVPAGRICVLVGHPDAARRPRCAW